MCGHVLCCCWWCFLLYVVNKKEMGSGKYTSEITATYSSARVAAAEITSFFANFGAKNN